MKIRRISFVCLSLSLVSAAASIAVRGEDAPAVKAGATPHLPTEAEMMASMVALAQPGEQHRLLAELVGTWTYTTKFGLAPGGALAGSGHGVAVRTAIMGGRYFVMDITGKMLIPGPDGKMQDVDFKGMSLDGYDNVKRAYVSAWVDSMGTSIVPSEGTYDPATKSFTYQFEMEPLPGMKTKAREVLRIVDADHHEMRWYESHGGQEVQTMEIDYSRKQ